MGAPRWDSKRQRWRVEFRSPRREERFFSTETGALAWQQQREQEIADDLAAERTRDRLAAAGWHLPAAQTIAPPGPLPTWQSFAAAFLHWLPISKAAPSTTRSYTSEINHTLLPLIGHLRLDELSPARVDWLRAFLERKGRTVGPPMTALSSMCNHAVRERFLAANPCHRPRGLYRADNAPPEPPPPRTLTRAQRQAIWDAWPAGRGRGLRIERGAFRLAGWCGLRLGEIRGLRVADLDLEAGLVQVRQQAQLVAGAGHFVRAPKYHSGRPVPLGPRTVELLAELADEARRLGVEILLAWQRSGRTPTMSDPSKGAKGRFARLQEAAEVCPLLQWRDLRHTFVTLAIEAGYPAALVDQWVGHSVGGMGRVGRRHYLGLWDPATLDRAGLD